MLSGIHVIKLAILFNVKNQIVVNGVINKKAAFKKLAKIKLKIIVIHFRLDQIAIYLIYVNGMNQQKFAKLKL